MVIPASLLRNTITIKPITATAVGPVDGVPFTVPCHYQLGNRGTGTSPTPALTAWVRPDTAISVGDNIETATHGELTVDEVLTHYGPAGYPTMLEVRAS